MINSCIKKLKTVFLFTTFQEIVELKNIGIFHMNSKTTEIINNVASILSKLLLCINLQLVSS